MNRSRSKLARGLMLVGWTSLLLLAGAGLSVAQEAPPPGGGPAGLQTENPAAARQDGQLTPASCSSCGGGTLCGPLPDVVGCPSTFCGHCCVPGRTHCCSICPEDDSFRRMCCGLYNCICCPDPCYEPRWISTANAAFFVDSPRPVTHMRLRYDGMWNIDRPDRAEYFIQSFSGDALGRRADINEFHLYNEIAPTPGFGFFIDLPWRSIDFDPSIVGTQAAGSSGFGDMSIGTKSVLLDCELIVVTFQFTTYIPTGRGSTGLGTGHVSLEPAILTSIKLAPDFYFQCQSAYWIPIGGGANAGNIWHNHFSFNKVLYRFLPDVELIGTLEFINWNMLDGGFTETEVLANGEVFSVPDRDIFFNFGPGLRLNICNKVDVGVGTHFSLGGDSFIGQAVRAELRWRF